jgi:hypothetical protein
MTVKNKNTGTNVIAASWQKKSKAGNVLLGFVIAEIWL